MNKRERLDRCKAEGRCPNCFNKHDGEYLYCDRCLKQREKYLKPRFCKECNTPLPPRTRLYYCEECRAKRPKNDWRTWFYNQTPEKQRTIRENGKNYIAALRREHPEEFQNEQLGRRYGIDYAIALDMYTNQKGRCAICSKQLPSLFDSNVPHSQKPHIDHNHKTGKVRGLLCVQCNHLIGNCMEDISILEAAIQFLKLHNAHD